MKQVRTFGYVVGFRSYLGAAAAVVRVKQGEHPLDGKKMLVWRMEASLDLRPVQLRAGDDVSFEILDWPLRDAVTGRNSVVHLAADVRVENTHLKNFQQGVRSTLWSILRLLPRRIRLAQQQR